MESRDNSLECNSAVPLCLLKQILEVESHLHIFLQIVLGSDVSNTQIICKLIVIQTAAFVVKHLSLLFSGKQRRK